jgi:hypothetical protein
MRHTRCSCHRHRMMTRRFLRRPVPTTTLIGLLVGSALACTNNDGSSSDDNNFREDVVWCEEALAQLTSCCGGFDPTKVKCHYHDYSGGGCSGVYNWEHPALSIEESRCILGESCGALNANGVCARAQAATPYTSSSSGGSCASLASGTRCDDDASTHPPVCP